MAAHDRRSNAAATGKKFRGRALTQEKHLRFSCASDAGGANVGTDPERVLPQQPIGADTRPDWSRVTRVQRHGPRAADTARGRARLRYVPTATAAPAAASRV